MFLKYFIVFLYLIFKNEFVFCNNVNRTFKIQGDQFIKDGVPFQYISGSFHYFRSVHQRWDDILQKFKLAGLNAVQTYVEWSLHQPTLGQEYNFEGNADLFKFLDLAQENDLLVILRPGPFIDAERDMGGLPSWLLWQKQNIKLRTTDLEYNYYVSRWFDHLLPRLLPYLYENGGPIIMVQVENEYGSFGCDKNYTMFIRDLIRLHLGENVLLFTTDGNGVTNLKCGTIPDVYPTVDFGPGASVQDSFVIQRQFGYGPYVNSEFYPGWLDHWQRPHSVIKSDAVVSTLDDMLEYGANVNFYMFYGGTSFGYKAGSNLDNGIFDACPTSYDYDAPLNEAGDPTEKYFKIKSTIRSYKDVPKENPVISPKGNYGSVQLKPFSFVLEKDLLNLLETVPITSNHTLSFEDLKIGSGFVLYETIINYITSDPVLLITPELRDRGYVYVDDLFVGILSRSEKIFSIPISVPKNGKISLLVENQGRICYGSEIGESKGIGSKVYLGNRELFNWKMYRLGELNVETLTSYARKIMRRSNSDTNLSLNTKNKYGSSTFYYGSLSINVTNNDTLLDTFVRFDGWTKGVIWVNGFNLGRYWPIVGPQKTLYLPSPLLKSYPDINTFIIFELEGPPDDCVPTFNSNFYNDCNIYLSDTHIVNSSTPYSTQHKFYNHIQHNNRIIENNINFGICDNEIHK